MIKRIVLIAIVMLALSLMGQYSECTPDSDKDGVIDPQDNCKDVYNPYQTDKDGDGIGDACDVLASCKQIFDLRKDVEPKIESGTYTIDPENSGETIEVFCDMTTDGGGWTLILNRITSSDNSGQPDLNTTNGTYNDARTANWNLSVNTFWEEMTEMVFAVKHSNPCKDCEIGGYDSAIMTARPSQSAYSKTCTTTSDVISVTKLVGTSAGTTSTAYMCGASLGWGSCSGSVCHYGVHSSNTSSDGSWSWNAWNEMHFPSAYSSYRSYYNNNHSWCRSCGGALSPVLNNSTTCCNSSGYDDLSTWTLWVR